MKISKSYLVQIIKEEMEHLMREGDDIFDEPLQIQKGRMPVGKVAVIKQIASKLNKDDYYAERFQQALESLDPGSELVFVPNLGQKKDYSDTRVNVDKHMGKKRAGTIFSAPYPWFEDNGFGQITGQLKDYLGELFVARERAQGGGEQPVTETDARHLAQAAKGVKDAAASGQEKGPGGMKAANKKLVKTKNQYHGDKYKDPESGEEKTRQYGDKERNFVAKRLKEEDKGGKRRGTPQAAAAKMADQFG